MTESASTVALRAVEPADLAFLQALANDPEVRSNVVDWDWPLSLAGQQEWFPSTLSDRTTRRFIVETPDGAPVGMTGLWDLDWRNRIALTGLKLGGTTDVRGKGYGTSAINAIMDFAFLDAGLNKLYATVLADNARSLAAYVRKCGWTEEGRLRQHAWRGGRYVDLVQIGILRSEYDALRESA
jgi:RimJ/RimL family protein N-acetyltransferase